jgi:predicted ATPase/class 3 adenylate cyclase
MAWVARGRPFFISLFKKDYCRHNNHPQRMGFMTTRPTGTVSFLFTDIQGSTALAQEHPAAMPALLKRHHEILQQAIEGHHGVVFQIIGDAFCAAFFTAPDALGAALAAQRALCSEDWQPVPVRVRMGLHTGAAEAEQAGGYSGYLTLTRVQRVMSVAHGGQILLSQAAAELVRPSLPAGVSLRDLGQQRLKGLAMPDHLWQVDAAGLPRDFPPLRSRQAIPNNLPAQLTSFIGRERELAEVRDALRQHRLVTLTGSGGAGKSRLSLQVAAGMQDQFADGVWFVELAPLSEGGLIPQTILAAAQVRVQQGGTVLESLVDFLREKTCLLVLDNCEHLIEDCARLAGTLLRSAPGLKILASSREALGVSGEQAWHVPSLSVPDPAHLPPAQQLSGYEAVRLFTERACLVQPHFRVTDGNALAVAQVCRRLDGIPLAIELAAARIRTLAVDKIAARLDDCFHLLTGGARTALPRQQTLRALIDWSHDLLSDGERTLLRRLAVFAGGWTLETAEQICSGGDLRVEDVMDLLDHLVDKSLVVVKEEQDGERRYSLLETVRQYAREKLTGCGESTAIQDRHLAYFLDWMRAIEPGLRGPQQVELMRRVENDLDNLRAAMEWSRQSDPQAGMELAFRLKWFWHLYSLMEECAHWLKGLLAVAPKTGLPTDTLLRAGAYSVLSWVVIWLDEGAASAIDYLQESVRLVENEAGPMADLIRADNLYTAGVLALVGRDYRQAELLGRQCLEAYRACGSRFGMAEACIVLYSHAFDRGDLAASRRWNETAIALRKEVGDKDGLAFDLTMGSLVPFSMGDYQGTKRMLAPALEAGKETRFKYTLGLSLCLWGMTCLFEGDLSQALDSFSQQAALAAEASDPFLKTFTVYYLTLLLLKHGRYRPGLLLSGALEGSNRYEAVLLYETRVVRDAFQKYRLEAREALGEAEHDAAYAEGRLLSLDQAVAYGLQEAESVLSRLPGRRR